MTAFRTSAFFAVTLMLGATLAPGESRADSLRQVAVDCNGAQTFVSAPDQTIEAILPDNTSVVLAPSSSASITCDGGAIRVSLDEGLVRIAGGATNATAPITIVTTQATMLLVAGSAIVNASGGRTRTHLLTGRELIVSADGTSRRLYRSGFEVSASGGAPTTPRRMSREEVLADLLALSRGLRDGIPPDLRGRRSAPSGGPLDARADEDGEDVAFSDIEQESADPDPRTVEDETPTGPETPEPETPEPDAFDLAAEFDVGLADTGDAVSTGTINETPSTTEDGRITILRQGYQEPFLFGKTYLGARTNRKFGSSSLTVALDDCGTENCAPVGIETTKSDDGQLGGVGYFYGNPGTKERPSAWGLTSDFEESAYQSGLIRFSYEASEEDASVYYSLATTNDYSTFVEDFDTFRSFENSDNLDVLRADTTLGAGPEPGALDTIFNLDAAEQAAGKVWHTGIGAEMTYFLARDEAGDGVTKNPLLPYAPPVRTDFFQLMDMKLLRAANWVAAGCGDNCEKAFNDAIEARFPDGSIVAPSDWPNSSISGDLLITAAALVDTGEDLGRYIFATGGLHTLLDLEPEQRGPGHRIDEFSLAEGMPGSGDAGMDLSTSRAFMTGLSWTGLDGGTRFSPSVSDLRQSPFYVVNPDGVVEGAGAQTPKLFYADYGLKTVTEDGIDRQISTISATIGNVVFTSYEEDDPATNALGIEASLGVVMNMQTIGSSRAVDAAGKSTGAVLSYGQTQSTAVGGNNPELPLNEGRLGYFVLENYGRIFDDMDERDRLEGGTDLAMDGSSARYALLRVGAATASAPVDASNRVAGISGLGYAAGFLEYQKGDGVAATAFGNTDLRSAALDPNEITDETGLRANLSFSDYDSATNSFSATLQFGDDQIVMGEVDGTSAFVRDGVYGARTTAAGEGDTGETVTRRVALVSGASVEAGATDSPDSPYVKWGYFFGDLDTGAAGGTRTHAHLGSYAAGAELTSDEASNIGCATSAERNCLGASNPLRANVKYSGHAIGNVRQGNTIRTVTGSYSDTFDFASRTGEATMNFDGRSVTGATAASSSFRNYTGLLTDGATNPATGAYSGTLAEVNGRFVGPNVTASSPDRGAMKAPAGLVGAFSMSDQQQNGYRAVGTIAATPAAPGG
ncbi:hypothetical protein E0K89_000985 [Aquicoccus sp. SCR17]|nr:hypothetical protein [Carideicomes alvinocaridis]